jgi:hypothetical protein
MSIVDDDFDDERVLPDALPSLQHLRDIHRPTPHPSGPLLETYSYLGVQYYLDESDVRAAELAFQDHIEACEEFDMDGCDPASPYCGCSDCYFRITAGFWISYAIDAIRRGAASVNQPPPTNPDQLVLEL